MAKEFIILYLMGLNAKGYQIGDPISQMKYGRELMELINKAPGYLIGQAINLQSLYEVILYEARNKGLI